MNPVHLIMALVHVQISAPEGYSNGWSDLAHTIPRVADSLSRYTRFHLSLFGVDWTDYATTAPTGQLLIQSRFRMNLAMNKAKNESVIRITERVRAISRSNSNPI